MNKIGIYYAFWINDWNVDFHEYVDKVADLGFDILEVNAGTVANMTSDERKKLKAHADSKKIDLTYCIGLTHEFDIASADDATRKRGIEFLKKQARSVGEIGGGKVSGIIYSSWPATMPEGETDKRPYLDRSIASMKEAIKAAEENDVIFNVEVVNRFEQYLLNTAEEAVEYVKRVGSPNVKILLDTFHMNIEEDTISKAIETAGGYLGHVHIGENNRKPPGYGHIPWEELASALKRINYQGAIVMEPFLIPGGQVGRDIKVWRDMSVGVDLDEEARKAVTFIRKKLAEA
ncbi:MAG: sugar phosphate isomerase/epimerase [Anaerolineaceae bacterium]|nr:sugar phosphate isomerase/epimerase [Anaerolineaceae bacterium]